MHPLLAYRFPGMDPWLENPLFWPGVHDMLIVNLAQELTARLAPRYVAWPGDRMVLEELPLDPHRKRRAPDVSLLRGAYAEGAAAGTALVADPGVTVDCGPLEVRQPFLEIQSVQHGLRVVTVIEVVSPSNKEPGTDARKKYLEKQAEVLQSEVHLVEIDLLRGGAHTVAIPRSAVAGLGPHAYLVAVRRAGSREQAQVYPIALRDRLPRIPIPLLPPDPDAVVDLQDLVRRVYELGGAAVRIDYRAPPDPPLSAEEAAWAQELLRAHSGETRAS